MKNPRKTPTKEQKQWMKEAGYTEAQLDKFWAENIDTNSLIRNLDTHGMTWRDLNLSCVAQLPTQKEKDLKTIEEKAAKEKADREAEEKKKMDKEYYWAHFDEIMLSKIDTKEKLTEDELKTLVYECDIQTEKGENGRWSRTNETIVKLKDRYFSIIWDQGLTEMQPNEFYNQPIEVEKKTYEKTITVTEWVALEGK